ncbi:glycosyltransferase family 2 protein [Arenimonas metalli]|uniref:Bactoprenol glucosyl transferase n=1 Tax=Arenimonas metalli CF5-1 TaxID=1384056 RepID=A0A091B2B7_9GAMM|nr:glycosyltransferase family 2 protein [Arenimonas metalli]KFN45712.1 bactoprenol glucosyl transferase [Arenimonas metalli CF5-1]
MANPQSITVVIAAYNEEAALPVFHPRLMKVLDGLDLAARVLYVDDGSRDGTFAMLQAFAGADPRVGVIGLARNFGKELALTAGLDHAEGDAVVVLDADGQDPPELIPALVAKWREGYDVVYGTRTRRDGETWFKRFSAAAFYRVMAWLSRTDIPRDTGDFRLMSRPVLDALRGLRERQRFMKGLFTWVGFRQVSFPYERESRMAGRTSFNYWKLWNLALEGITSFSTVPLRLATYLGLFTALAAFGWGVWIIVRTLAWDDPVQGWPSLMIVVLFLGGLQLVALGIIGEYLGRLYMEAKQRPLYLIRTFVRQPPVGGTSVPMLSGEGHRD